MLSFVGWRKTHLPNCGRKSARALNTAVMEGEVLDLEVAYLADLQTELHAHMATLRGAFEGNLAYWAAEP